MTFTAKLRDNFYDETFSLCPALSKPDPRANGNNSGYFADIRLIGILTELVAPIWTLPRQNDPILLK
ncbi:hypothetical protein D1872_264140 [compost metagenome]